MQGVVSEGYKSADPQAALAPLSLFLLPILFILLQTKQIGRNPVPCFKAASLLSLSLFLSLIKQKYMLSLSPHLKIKKNSYGMHFFPFSKNIKYHPLLSLSFRSLSIKNSVFLKLKKKKNCTASPLPLKTYFKK